MSDTPLIDPLKGKNVQIIQAKGKPGGQPGNKNALKHGFRGLPALEWFRDLPALERFMFHGCAPERRGLCVPERKLREGKREVLFHGCVPERHVLCAREG